MCGARLAAPAPDGSAATLPGGTTPPVVVAVPDEPPAQNVLYLSEHDSGSAGANHRAHEYEGVSTPDPVEAPPEPAGPPPPAATPIRPLGVDPVDAQREYVRARAAQVEAALPAFGSHGPTPQPHELVPPPRDPENPFGDFFGDGPSAWLEDEDSASEHEQGESRLVSTLIATAAIGMLVAGWVVWGAAMVRGAGGAESGGFVLLAMLLWIWYLSLPRERQHRFLLRRHTRLRDLVDRRTGRIRERTEGQLSMRRERERYRAMRDERTRRVNALGEGAYRSFRHGQLPADLHAGAQRVLAMERQMLGQDQRIHALDAERRSRSAGGSRGVADSAAPGGADPAGPPPHGGHPGP
ncbi:MAG: hypothetical protein JWM98_1284 [Thermoleophilia bacterium]|nr:hypothetical protein [Thermoleophilia bacterium]